MRRLFSLTLLQIDLIRTIITIPLIINYYLYHREQHPKKYHMISNLDYLFVSLLVSVYPRFSP